MGSAITTVVGLAAMFVLFSTLASGILSAGQRLARARNKELFASIGRLLDNTPTPDSYSLTMRLYETDAVKALSPPARRVVPGARPGPYATPPQVTARNGPDYIPAWVFCDVVEDLKSGTAPRAEAQSQARFALDGLRTDEFDPTETNRLSELYQTAMRSATDRYRLRSKFWLFGVGLLIALVVNVDSIAVARSLWEDETVRETLAEDAAACGDRQCINEVTSDVRSRVQLPIGWLCERPTPDDRMAPDSDEDVDDMAPRPPALDGCNAWNSVREAFPHAIPGWLLTALGISLGAPVWFDVVRGLTGVRRRPSS